MSNITQKIDAVLAREIGPGEPGAVVAVLRDGAFVHCQTYGLANLEWNIPLPTDAIFHIASLTKPFTAVAIMMLRERGLISLDAPMVDYLPEFPLDGRRVTVRQLLNHTSGIKSYSAFPNFYRETARLHSPLAILLERLKGHRFDFEPGDRYLYNNSGYVLLGAIIEKASGAKYRDFLKREIFDPLEMARTSYLFDEPTVAKRAAGYQRGRTGFENASYISATCYHAAGGLGSTVQDLAKWDRAIRSNRLISAETFSEMLHPTRLNDGSDFPYGLGWGLAEYRARRIFHHAGGRNGFASHMVHLRDEDITTIVLSNLYLFPFDRVTRGLLRAVLDEPEMEFRQAPLTRADAAQFIGRYRSDEITREIVATGNGLAFAEPQSPQLIRVSESAFREEGDPEIEYRFCGHSDGRYQMFDYVPPLFPTATYARVPSAPSVSQR